MYLSGTIFSSDSEVFSGTFVFTNHNLFDTLCTCVSTAITFVQNNTWETTFAVLIPTQGRVVKDFKSEDNISGFFSKISQVA